jgi:carboxyl-terminal processing protease
VRLRYPLRRTLLLLLLLGSALAQSPNLLASVQGRTTEFNAVVDVFKEHYWNPSYTNWDKWADTYRQAALSATTRRAFNSVMRRMVYALHDDHSNWLGRVDITAGESVSQTQSAPQPGLGILHAYLPGSGIVLERVYPNTPAYQAGLRRGDVITRINGQDVRQAKSPNAVQKILAGAVAADKVELGVRHGLQSQTVSVRPAPVNFGAVSSKPEGYMLTDNIGYIYLPTFNAAHIGDEVHQLVHKLQQQGATSLVLDLRGNLGGRLGELGLTLGAFISGPWAEAVSHGKIAWKASYAIEGNEGVNTLTTPAGEVISESALTAPPAHFTGPLVVLVNSRNSSAGEIFPLVLLNLHRATAIGEQTEGNVEAVRPFELPDGSEVMVAVANVEAADSTSFDGGVTPQVHAVSELSQLARGYDAPVAQALKALKDLPFTPGKYF